MFLVESSSSSSASPSPPSFSVASQLLLGYGRRQSRRQKARNTYEDKDDPRIRGGIIVFDSSVGEEPFADHLIAFVFRRGIETRNPSHRVEPADADAVGCRTLRIAINGVFPDYQVGHPSEINFRVLHDSESEGSENNNPATGAPTISGSARVGRTLTARTGSIRDADGLTG